MSDIAQDVMDILSDDPVVETVVEPAVEPVPVAPVAVETPIVPVVETSPSAEPPIVEDLGMPQEPSPTPIPAPVVPVQAPVSGEVDQLRAQIASMQALIENLSTQVTAPREAPVAAQPAAAGAIKFIEKEEDLDKALNSADNFNAMLTGVVQKAQEAMLVNLPQVVAQMADRIVNQRLAAKEFYDNNKDLTANKAFVSIVANELAAANPGWDMPKLIENLSGEVRKRLNLVVGATNQPAFVPPSSPAFVPGAGARPGGGAPQIDQMSKDIMELISD